MAFANRVNNGEPTLNAVLTTDIDMTGQAWNAPIGDWTVNQDLDNWTIGQSNNCNCQIYNLIGQRISKKQKGVNIVNSKKVLVE